MTADRAKDRSTDFTRLISSIKLKEIIQIAIESRRFGDPPGEAGGALNMEWNQAVGKDDPVKFSEISIQFRIRYEFKISFGGNPLFRHIAEFSMFFELMDAATFWSLWADEELQDIFRNRQVLRVLWPFLRQQIHDGMLRLALPPVALPLFM